MKYRGVFYAVLLLLLLPSIILPSGAHVPIMASGNNNPETATYIQDPLKSWAVYDELKSGMDVHYYRFHMTQGNTLHLSLFVPEKGTFIPSFAIMGPGIESRGHPPSYLEIPDRSGVLVVEGKLPNRAIYEPFTPASYYNLAEIDLVITEESDYYVAVYDPSGMGSYGLAIGSREEFEPYEWIIVPVNVISLHLWEGQSWGFIFAPMLATVITGFIILYRKRNMRSTSLSGLIGSFAGLLYMGSGAVIFIQMINAMSRVSFTNEIIITFLLAILPVLSGLAVLHIALQNTLDVKSRAKLVILGVAGLFIWAGLVIGPILVIISGILPSARITSKPHSE